MRPVLVVLAVTALVSAAACAGGGAGRNGVTEESLKRAVADWNDFPAERHPRPIVLLEDLPAVSAAVKGANRAEASGGLSTRSPGSVVVALSDGDARLAQISAAEAFGQMAAHIAKTPGEPKVARIVRGQYGARMWITDRGPTELPTWTFFTDSGGTAAWPALAPGVFWRLGALRPSATVEVMSVASGGTRLSASMMWPPAGCDGETRVDMLRRESETVVLIGLRRPVSARAGYCDRNASGQVSERVIQLSEPLGGRVVIDPEGFPVPVRR